MPRILFVGEAVSLAHVSRPAVLARWAREAGYEVHFACGPAFAGIARAEGLDPIEMPTIVSNVFYDRLAAGRFFYTTEELSQYVRAERELIQRVRPDLVVGDFRLTLDLSTTLTGTPLLSLSNAHWNPAGTCRFSAPRAGLWRMLPPSLRERLFAPLRPLAFRFFAEPLNQVRRQFSFPARVDFREHYTAGRWCAYLDLPELYQDSGHGRLPAVPVLPKGHFFLGPVPWAPQVPAASKLATETWDSVARAAAVCSWLPVHNPVTWNNSGDSGNSHGQPTTNSGCPCHTYPCRCTTEDRPLVYVSLGSSGDRRVLPVLLRALLRFPVRIVLSGIEGEQATALRKALPEIAGRCAMAPLIDPQEVLTHARLTVCHGGSGTVYQSLAAGVPMLCLPANPDQALISAAVASRGAGLTVNPERCTTHHLSDALAELLHRTFFAREAGELQSALARHDTRKCWLNFLASAVPHRSMRPAPTLVEA